VAPRASEEEEDIEEADGDVERVRHRYGTSLSDGTDPTRRETRGKAVSDVECGCSRDRAAP
jgi:hypothetical protein